ncbi:MAG: hypothetical protein ACRBDI_05980 [Alphaproteobacteria bacterium]
MFDEAFDKLELNEVAVILDDVNKSVEGSVFDPLETTILSIEVPFYKGYRFLHIADYATTPPLERYVFQKNDTRDFTIIDWNYKTIQKLNQDVPINLTDENIFEYIRFYFKFVKMRFGRFTICESADNIQWKDEPSSEIKQALNKTLKFLEINEKRKDGVYKVNAFMMMKDILFNVDIYVEPNGRVTMADQEVVIENVPVLDSALGH